MEEYRNYVDDINRHLPPAFQDIDPTELQLVRLYPKEGLTQIDPARRLIESMNKQLTRATMSEAG